MQKYMSAWYSFINMIEDLMQLWGVWRDSSNILLTKQLFSMTRIDPESFPGILKENQSLFKIKQQKLPKKPQNDSKQTKKPKTQNRRKKQLNYKPFMWKKKSQRIFLPIYQQSNPNMPG